MYNEFCVLDIGAQGSLETMMQRKASILAVDDELRLLRLVRVNLVRAGFEVIYEYNGSASLKQMAAEPPDAVVLDITMPGIDGFTLTQQIREISNVPIIMLTAMSEQSQNDRGPAIGPDD